MRRWTRRSDGCKHCAAVRASALLQLQNLLAQTVGGSLHGALEGAFDQETGERDQRIDFEVVADLGLVTRRCQCVRGTLGLQLARLDQDRTDGVVTPGVLDLLVVIQPGGLDRDPDQFGSAALMGLEDLRANRWRPWPDSSEPDSSYGAVCR